MSFADAAQGSWVTMTGDFKGADVLSKEKANGYFR